MHCHHHCSTKKMSVGPWSLSQKKGNQVDRVSLKSKKNCTSFQFFMHLLFQFFQAFPAKISQSKSVASIHEKILLLLVAIWPTRFCHHQKTKFKQQKKKQHVDLSGGRFVGPSCPPLWWGGTFVFCQKESCKSQASSFGFVLHASEGPATITVSKKSCKSQEDCFGCVFHASDAPSHHHCVKKNHASHEKIGHLFWMQLRAKPPVQAMMAILNQCGWIHGIEMVLK